MTEAMGPATQITPAEHGDESRADEAVRPSLGANRTIVRRTAVLALIVAAFATGAVGYSLLQPTVYGAQVDILLTPRAELSDTAADRALLTQAMIVKSPSVLQPAATRTDIPLARLDEAVTAEMVGRTNVLRVTVADSDRRRAVTAAQLIAVQYSLAATTGATNAPAPVAATILSPARPLADPLQPRPWRALAAGALLGLFTAAAVAIVLWRPRQRIWSSLDRT